MAFLRSGTALTRSGVYCWLVFTVLVLSLVPRPARALVVPEGVVLSENGCGRATAYTDSNKIISWDDKTHVAWLDSTTTGTGFGVRMRTLDRATGQWSPIYSIGEAQDNHGGPALTIDSQGYLHVVYYPHGNGNQFRYRTSIRPNDASEWTAEAIVGTSVTYPKLLCGPDDTLYLTCRGTNVNPPEARLYTKSPGGSWSSPRSLLKADVTGYANFGEMLTWSPDHQTLHLACKFFDNYLGGSCHSISYMKSSDFGQTWTRYDGTPVALPGTANSLDPVVMIPQEDRPYFTSGTSLTLGGIAVDASGMPHILYSNYTGTAPPRELWMATPNAAGGWDHNMLTDWIDELPEGWGVQARDLTIDEQGKMHAIVNISDDVNEASIYGAPSNEVVWLESLDLGQTWTSYLVSEVDPTTPHWQPNLERQTGWNAVEMPSVIYTSGDPGAGLNDLLANDVIWVPLVVDVPGDATRDGKVDAADAAILARHWLSRDATWMMGDFNGDTWVNDLDASILAAHWAYGTAAASVPEPSALALLLAGAILFELRGRRGRQRDMTQGTNVHAVSG